MNGIELFLVALAGAWALTAMLNWLALGPWRRAAGAHWAERARLLFTARVAQVHNTMVLMLLVPLLAIGFGRTKDDSLFFCSVAGALGGATLSAFALARKMWPGVRGWDWLRQAFVMILLRGFLMLVVIVIVASMPDEFNTTTFLLGAVVLLLILALIFGLHLLLLRALHFVSPAPERLRGLAQRAATAVGAQLRTVWICPGPVAQAYALIPTKQMLFTAPMLEKLTDDELAGVCAHEAAHLAEPQRVVAQRLMAPFCLYLLIFINPVAHQFGTGGVVLLFVPFCLTVMMFRPRKPQRPAPAKDGEAKTTDGGSVAPPPLQSPRSPSLSRRMEERADELAAQAGDPATYARALALMYEHNQMPAVMPPRRAARAHPDLYDRMIKAGVIPDFPKPSPPQRFVWTTWLLAFLVGALYGGIISMAYIIRSLK